MVSDVPNGKVGAVIMTPAIAKSFKIYVDERLQQVEKSIYTHEQILASLKKEQANLRTFRETLKTAACKQCGGTGELVHYDGGDGYFTQCSSCKGTGLPNA